MKTGNAIVDAVGAINISGNVIPQAWYKTITKETGKPYLAAIVILSDIVYWYRPTEQRDESTGQVVAARTKFRSDLLQRSYQQLADQFGITKRDATNAIVALEHLGVVKRHFRKMEIGGVTLNNVLFLELIPDGLMKVTFPDGTGTDQIGDTYHRNRGEGTPKSVTPFTQIGETNTETTQETSQETSKGKDKGAERPTSHRQKANKPESLQEVRDYIREMGYGLDPEEFWDANEQAGWKLKNGKPVQDWKARVRTFERNRKKWGHEGAYRKTDEERYAKPKGAAVALPF